MKNIFLTGATSGIGFMVACKLASCGNRIIATARSFEKGKALQTYYERNFPKGKGTIEIVQCDLNSFEPITRACNQVIANTSCIDVLINNAGVWNFKYRESRNNIEETLQVNVLAPLLINHLLIKHLLKSNDPKSIFTASSIHYGTMNLDDLEFRNNFNGFKAYRQSKLELILLCRLFAEKFKYLPIGFYSQHPGFISTELGRNADWFSRFFFKTLGGPPEKGAGTLVHLSMKDKAYLTSGEYYVNKKIKEISEITYDLDLAETLLERLNEYLTDYVDVPSVILGSTTKHYAV